MGRVSLDTIARQIAQTKPNSQIRRVRFPVQAGDPFVVQIESAGKLLELVCDASTGWVLGVLNTGFTDWMIDLHRNLLAGKTGRKAVGAAGILLFVMARTGMLLWLIGARNWRAWISVRAQGSSRRFHFELHRASGLWSYGLLTVLAFTGIGLAYPDTFRDALQQITGSPLAKKAPRVVAFGGRTLPSLNEYVLQGGRVIPDGMPMELRLPDNKKGPVDLRLRRRATSHSAATTYIAILHRQGAGAQRRGGSTAGGAHLWGLRANSLR